MTRAGGGRNYDVRDEASGDVDEVRRVNELAFGRPDEAALVDALRGGPDTISLVAVSGATVIWAHLLHAGSCRDICWYVARRRSRADGRDPAPAEAGCGIGTRAGRRGGVPVS